MKILTVIGTRPQIIKSAAITLPILERFHEQITEVVVHTGQHYHRNMSDIFFSEMGLPAPKYNLAIGSGRHGAQTAAMMLEIENIIFEEKPAVVLIYGDTNSTMAAALAAAKIGVPVAHVEAGMRSFNKAMPEEINRVISDHVSSFLFCSTTTAVDNLRKEGFTDRSFGGIDAPLVKKVGDIMYDNALRFGTDDAFDFEKYQVRPGHFMLATIHRTSNTQSIDQILGLLRDINQLSQETDKRTLLPLHPRTRNLIDSLMGGLPIKGCESIEFCEPLSYREILSCLRKASLVITDSGGLQKEAAFFNTPSVVLRAETEWTELIDFGLARLSNPKNGDFLRNCHLQLASKATLPFGFYGDGRAGDDILATLLAYYSPSH